MELLGIEPYFERPGYREFRLGDRQEELGLIDRRYAPGEAAPGPAGAIAYWHVDDVRALAAAASQDDETTAHVLRHTFGTTLVRGGADLVLVAELMGHSRLETTRGYTRPTAEDRAKALELLPTDR